MHIGNIEDSRVPLSSYPWWEAEVLIFQPAKKTSERHDCLHSLTSVLCPISHTRLPMSNFSRFLVSVENIEDKIFIVMHDLELIYVYNRTNSEL